MGKAQTVFTGIEERHTQGVHPLLGPMDVLFMKATKCEWGGKCKFCSYWMDNTKSEDEALKVNGDLLLSLCTTSPLKHKVVSISPSASWFDIPASARSAFMAHMRDSGVTDFISESTWSYRERFIQEEKIVKNCFPTMRFWHKMGIETFDNEVRAKLGKDYVIRDPLDVFKYTKKIILLVGSIHHTKEVIDRDIALGLAHADLLEVNIINDGFSPNKLEDPELIKYVYEKWAPLLRTIPKVVFTEDPATAWGASINKKTIPIQPIKDQHDQQF